MSAQRRTSPRLTVKPKSHNPYAKKARHAAEFSISDVTACVYAPRRFFEQKTYSTVCKNAKLRLLTRNPFLTLHCYKLEMEA